MLTTKSKNLKMSENEIIIDFNMRIYDISDKFFNLGELFAEEKMVQEVLRSLHSGFDLKVTTIEEAQDVHNMKLDALI